MTMPVTYVELNSPDLDATRTFFSEVFDWDLQPFATAEYLVAPSGEAPGIDAGVLASRDGNPFAVPVIRVESIDALRPKIELGGGKMVVEPFSIPGVGNGCYILDPAGLLIGLHEYEASSSALRDL